MERFGVNIVYKTGYEDCVQQVPGVSGLSLIVICDGLK
jgi:hypothetical protein